MQMADVLDHRGRARSRTFSSEDDVFTNEIDCLNAVLDGKTPPVKPKVDQAAVSKPPVSKKTVDIMTKLDHNTTRLPDAMSEGSKSATVDDEEAAAEKELAEMERNKRAAAAAASPDGARSASTGPRNSVARKKKPEDGEYDIQVKILLLGDSGVGKTSLMLRYSEDKFSTSLISTAGVDYKSQMLLVEGKRVKCQIWDTAGQQRFHVITHSYYKSAHGIVLVYDVSEPNEESFNNVRYWMENIQKHASPHTQKILVGNKTDMKGKKIESSRGKALADEYGMAFFETSAKEGSHVAEAFNSLAKEIVLKMQANPEVLTNDGVKVIKDKKEKDCVIM